MCSFVSQSILKLLQVWFKKITLVAKVKWILIKVCSIEILKIWFPEFESLIEILGTNQMIFLYDELVNRWNFSLYLWNRDIFIFKLYYYIGRDGKKWTRSAIISVQFSSVHESGSYFCWFLVHDREWSWLIFLSLVQFILSSFKFTKARLKEPIFSYKNYSYFNISSFLRISFLEFASQPFDSMLKNLKMLFHLSIFLPKK